MRDNFFHPDLGPVCDLGEGIEDWRGYHSSVRPTGLGMTLNLGECTQLFSENPTVKSLPCLV